MIQKQDGWECLFSISCYQCYVWFCNADSIIVDEILSWEAITCLSGTGNGCVLAFPFFFIGNYEELLGYVEAGLPL